MSKNDLNISIHKLLSGTLNLQLIGVTFIDHAIVFWMKYTLRSVPVISSKLQHINGSISI